MHLADGKWRCLYCGAAVDIPLDAEPSRIISAASDQPKYRVFVLDRKEVHRCEIASDEPPRA
jgi:hypothetical protein